MVKTVVKTAKKLWSKIGVWSYVGGLLIAVLIALMTTWSGAGIGPLSVLILAVLGVIVGLLNVTEGEVQLFLVASIAFVVAAVSMGSVFAVLGDAFNGAQTFMNAIVVFTAPGALVVAFKALYNIAKDE